MKPPPALRRAGLWTGACAGAYVLGAVIHSGTLLPRKSSASPAVDWRLDEHDRLAAFPGKTAMPCPDAHDRVAVLLILGQSNAANSAGHRWPAANRVLNFYAGQCYPSGSPLLGASGIQGESFTHVGELLIASERYDSVVLAPAAVSGSGIAHWAPGGGLHDMVMAAVDSLQTSLPVTHVIWQHGERDFALGTSREVYQQNLTTLTGALRAQGVTAPVLVSIASRCVETRAPWTADNAVTRAQRAVAGIDGMIQGVDTDRLITRADRHDDCHFGYGGQMKYAQALAARLLAIAN